MRRRRNPTPEELEIWHQVARTVRATRSARPVEGLTPPHHSHPDPSPVATGAAPAPVLPSFRLGEKAPPGAPAVQLPPSFAENLARQPLAMDAKTHSRMTRGRLDPDARIDLHGMTLAEAHSELIAFLLTAQSLGHRLVLVITGKGRPGSDHGPMPGRTGAIRHQLPHWLRLPPLAQATQQLAQAHQRHGGAGAFYVYLRRRAKG